MTGHPSAGSSGAGSSGAGSNRVAIDRLVIEAPGMSEQSARQLGEIVCSELGRQFGELSAAGYFAAGGRDALREGATLPGRRSTVRARHGEPLEELAARIARSALADALLMRGA
ncbi:MAG TPA: hypothetical protein VFN61_11905 [Acidimicrobiales bacterium]|nr:hypothetical protein [Acidimicrobiales bacterium]